MRILGGLESGSGWCFTAARVAGVANTLAEGISRWDSPSISAILRRFRPDVCWREQVLGQAGADLCSGILAASTSTLCYDIILTDLRERFSVVVYLSLPDGST